ncbi:MAG TPA: aldehyde ferredoxin oxidoreductase N-terminal domain-containing protein, partial [Bacillota bacterium]|nr:aldehyde ferredoxin oxidoreductase N-terminal domain-containing protein [Bacillota bacterium]
MMTIDLTHETFVAEERDDLPRWLGGVALATRLLAEEVDGERGGRPGAGPVVFASSPIAGLFPAATKGVAMFRSPLNGELGESYAGLGWATAMRLAGLTAIIMRGQANRPVWLKISNQGVQFNEAGRLWGLGCRAAGQMLDQRIATTGRGGLNTFTAGPGYSRLCIGPAGEKQIAFACATVDSFRHFGRLGLGAVLGGKRLKAVVISNTEEPPPQKNKGHLTEYKRVYAKIYKQLVQTESMTKYHDLGTTANILPLNEMGALPTFNLRQAAFKGAESISGEAFARDSLLRKLACRGCPVGCIHLGLYRRQINDNHDYQPMLYSYDYELVYALGALLG